MSPTPQYVIWITTDHMRFDCVGAYGNAAMRTPALDALAAHAVNFLHCYVQNPVSMPSRASFMTGLYPQQTGVTQNGHCLPADFSPTVAQLFANAGYRTAQIGKLHFQPHENHDLDPRARNSYGFDVFWLSEEKGCYEDAYVNWLRGRYPQYVEALRIPRPTDPERGKWETPGGKIVDAPWQATQAGWVVAMAEQYIRERRARDRHFLHLGFYDPHPPLNPTREAFAPYDGADIPLPQPVTNEGEDKPPPLRNHLRSRADWSRNDFVEYRRLFYALVTQVDLALGRLVAFLRDEGLLDRTLIVFSSDHGDMCGDHGITHKGVFYEQVMRVPLFLHWPEGLGKDRLDAEGLVEMVDVLPTLLGLCGATIPEALAGRSSALDLLARRAPAGRDDVLAYHASGDAMLRTDRWKYFRYNLTGDEVLFDLAEDPGEYVNRAADPACLDVLHDMRSRMLRRSLDASRSPLPRTHLY